MMAHLTGSWKIGLLLAIVLAPFLSSSTLGHAPLVLTPRHPCSSAQEGLDIPDIPIITKRASVCFQMPEPILDREGRIEAFSLPGCDFLAISGLPLLPIKVLTFKFAGRLYDVSVSVELGDVEELSLRHELRSVPRPMPAHLLRGSALTRAKQMPDVPPGPMPQRWYEHEVHYGIDPLDLTRKTFVFVRIYPLRLDVAEKRALFLRGANVIVEARGDTGRRSADSPEVHMLIITGEDLLPAAEGLASYRNASGIKTMIRTVEWISANYDGDDTPEKIRNCVKDVVDEYGITFLLIFGDHDVVPTRLAYIPDGYEDGYEGNKDRDGPLVETDLYYADLDWDWDNNGDGYWGDLDHDSVDGLPDVLVGRLPASDLDEAWTLVGKIQVYETASYNAPWLNNVLFIGTDLFTGEGFEGPEGEILKNHIETNYVGPEKSITKLYETEGTLSTTAVINAINSGCGFVNFAGHGAPNGWSLGTWGFFTTSLVDSLSNSEELCFVCTAACLTSRFSDWDCIGEHFLLKSGGGAIAYFGSTRVAWMLGDGYVASAFSGRVDAFFAQAYFSSGLPTVGQIWAYAIEHYIGLFSIKMLVEGYYLHWKTVAEYGAPFGDPSLCVQGRPTGLYDLEVVCYDADGEDPMEGVEVELSFLGAITFSDITGDEGAIMFEDLLPGRYELRATYMDITVAEKEVFVPDETSVQLNCSFYDLEIRCVDAGGEPLPGAVVGLYLDDALVAHGPTGQDGRLRVENLPPTEYGVRVNWTKPRVEEVYSGTLMVQEDEQVATLYCSLYDLVIEVVDLLNRPVEGAVVEVYTEDGLLVGSFTTGPDGRAEVEDLPVGIYRVVVSAELAKRAEAKFSVSAPGMTRVITVERFFSPSELYMIIGAIIILIVIGVAYVLYRRRKKRYPIYWPPPKRYRYPYPAPRQGYG